MPTIYFGDLHSDASGRQYCLCENDLIPLDLQRRGGKLVIRLSTGKYVDASSIGYEQDLARNRKVVVGEPDLFYAIYEDFYRSEQAHRNSKRNVIFGEAGSDMNGNSFVFNGERIRLSILRQGGKRMVRLSSGETLDATSVKSEFISGRGNCVVGNEWLFHKIYQDFQRAKQEKEEHGGGRIVIYGEYSTGANGTFLKVGDAHIRLNLLKGTDGAKFLMLSNGTVRRMDGVSFYAGIDNKQRIRGPEWLLLDILADFGVCVKEEERQRAEEQCAVIKLPRARARTVEYSVVEGAGKAVKTVKGALALAFAAVAMAVLSHFPSLDATKYFRAGDTDAGKAKTEIVVEAQAEMQGTGIYRNAWTGEQQAGVQGIASETAKAAPAKSAAKPKGAPVVHHPKIASVKESTSHAHAASGNANSAGVVWNSGGTVIDLSMKENTDIARRMGFEGIARKINPRMSAYETATMARKLARDNLKPGHDNINRWNVNDLRTPRMVRVY